MIPNRHPPQTQSNQMDPISARAPATLLNADPGKRLYILGLICAFTCLQLPGLVLSIISWNKSKNAGYPTAKAINAIIINSVLLILGVYILIGLARLSSMG